MGNILGLKGKRGKRGKNTYVRGRGREGEESEKWYY